MTDITPLPLRCEGATQYYSYMCADCGKEARNSYVEPIASRMLEARTCFYCDLARDRQKRLEKDHGRLTIIDGRIYGPGNRTSGSFRGMAGRRFDIEFIAPCHAVGRADRSAPERAQRTLRGGQCLLRRREHAGSARRRDDRHGQRGDAGGCAMTEPRYYARSASDRTDHWPLWFVADRQRGGLNVVIALMPSMSGRLPFLPREAALKLAHEANMKLALADHENYREPGEGATVRRADPIRGQVDHNLRHLQAAVDRRELKAWDGKPTLSPLVLKAERDAEIERLQNENASLRHSSLVARLSHEQLNRFIRLFDGAGFKGHQVDSQAKLAVEEIERLRETLRKIAAYDDDAAANAYLRSTGSYRCFDEPGAVELARGVLEGGGC